MVGSGSTLLYHLVLVPKYRQRILEGKLARRIKELFIECAEINRWCIEELHIQQDHVHLLIQLPPTISISKAVALIKDGSDNVVREEFPELSEFLWGDSFWAEGYFAETAGSCNSEIIQRYIQSQ
jgi:putative transposase